jgi:crotonobetainyl-CoA:carnitine CoA-transferase CaiB-like acyl-CoA transferase
MNFSDLKIIDLSTVLAGPSVGTFFAELGAEVIKIESPHFPDVTRSWKLPTEDSISDVSAYFSSVNYRKKFIQLDFSNSSHLEQLMKLFSDADILLTNFKKSSEEKFGLSAEILLKKFPKLIVGKISGFGEESDRIAYDLILQAETGFMSMNGTPDSGPVKMPVALIDVLAAHQLKEGILVALLDRISTNKGKKVSVSLYDAAISSLANQASNYLMEKHVPKRIGSLHPNIAPYGEIFKTKDEVLVTFAIGSDLHFQKLTRLLKLSSIVNDERFSSNQVRVKNRIELANILQNEISKSNAYEILEQCHKNYIPAARIKNLSEVFEDLHAKGLVREETISGKSTKRITSIAFKWK